jgi:lipase chaperone LimK
VIDILLYTFGPQLAEKLFSSWNQPEVQEPSFEADVQSALVQLAEQLQKKDSEIGAINKELRGLRLQNVSLQLNALDVQLRVIRKSLEDHIADECNFREAIIRKQKHWHIGFSLAVAFASSLALWCACR